MKTQLELAQVSAVAAMASDPENQFFGYDPKKRESKHGRG
jgi:hypothetical protein